MEVCSKYKKNTCCNETHMHTLRLYVASLFILYLGSK